MIFNVRHLDELEHFGEGVNVFDETSQDGELGQNSDSSTSWRRTLIERAAHNVRQVLHQPIEDDANYNSGQLLYDAKAKKFGRVLKSIPNYLKLSYISGGSKEYSPKSTNKAVETKKPIAHSVAAKAAVHSEPKKLDTKAKIHNNLSSNTNKIAMKKAPVKVKAASIVVSTKKPDAHKKQKTLAPSKNDPRKGASLNKKDISSKLGKKAVVAPKGQVQRSIADPIADPNSYIKKHFKLMSNKDLAVATGLSEHTIRRKLGEWGLKRPSPTQTPKRK